MTLSGPDWCDLYPTDATTATLVQPFRTCVQRFIGALERAGVAVHIRATLRPPERAWLMHWAWRVAREGFNPGMVPNNPGIPVGWVHPTRTAGVAAAEQMVRTYGLVVRASLTSRHIEGRAVDMDVFWAGVVQVVDGNAMRVTLSDMAGNETNPALHRVGGTFGVIKLRSDPPHWSDDGR